MVSWDKSDISTSTSSGIGLPPRLRPPPIPPQGPPPQPPHPPPPPPPAGPCPQPPPPLLAACSSFWRGSSLLCRFRFHLPATAFLGSSSGAGAACTGGASCGFPEGCGL